MGRQIGWVSPRLRREKLATGLEEFCADLPREAKIPDPCILVDGRWVRQNPPTDPAPQHPPAA